MKYVGLGCWRFFLSFLVAISHLYGHMIHGPAAYAVWGFYVLSGYLMVFIINERYGDNWAGLRKYARNRFVRIYPLYWIAFLFGCITIFMLQSDALDLKKLNPEFYFPLDWRDGFVATLLFPMLPKSGLPVPVSSALAIEIGFYMLIAIFACQRRSVWAVFVVSILINLNMGIVPETFANRYATFLPSLVAFLAGSLVYHHRGFLQKFRAPCLSMAVWCAHCAVWIKYGSWPWTYGLYVSVLLSTWVVISLESIKEAGVAKLLGEMSYPVYLFHTTVAAWFLDWFGFGRSFVFFAISFLATLALSYFAVVLIDRPFDRFKSHQLKHGDLDCEAKPGLKNL